MVEELHNAAANITVRWAEGLDTLVLKEIKVTPPPEDAYNPQDSKVVGSAS